MSSSEDRSPGAPAPGQSRGLRALLRRFRKDRALAGDAPAPDDENRLVVQAAAFHTLRVDDVMTPRADIVAVDLAATFSEVVARFVEAEHSRMPIYRETLDDPVGVVHVKDVFRLLAANGAGPDPDQPILHRLRRDALYVPASMRAADLLLRMQAQRIHMALVIDEFGGTDGLVTLEDLVESVMGDIADEHDEQAPIGVERVGAGFEADARTPLDALEEAVGQPLAPPDLEEEIETVAGLVTALAGRVPQRGEVIPHPDGFELHVVDADTRRVKRVRLIRAAPPETEAPSAAKSAAKASG